jgi:hypothetical protein
MYIRTLYEAGLCIQTLRSQSKPKITATALAKTCEISRDTLHRMEQGEDVSLSAFLNAIRALGYELVTQAKTRPTLHTLGEHFPELGS